jgi:hypothetical protein
VTRKARIALIISGLVVFTLVAVCVLVSSLGSTVSVFFGCTAATSPAVGAVVQQPTRVHELLPKLGAVSTVHWQDRELRVRLCPDAGPMTHETSGFAVLDRSVADAYRTAYAWSPASTPDVPADLTPFAPAHPQWTDAAAFDSAMGTGRFRYDVATGTLFFAVDFQH